MNVYTPVPEVNVVPLCVNPPWNMNAELPELFHTPLPEIVTRPTNVFVPVALEMVSVPFTSVVLFIAMAVAAPIVNVPVTVAAPFTVNVPALMVKLPPKVIASFDVNVMMEDVPVRFKIPAAGFINPPVPASAVEIVTPLAWILLFVSVMPVAVILPNVN